MLPQVCVSSQAQGLKPGAQDCIGRSAALPARVESARWTPGGRGGLQVRGKHSRERTRSNADTCCVVAGTGWGEEGKDTGLWAGGGCPEQALGT